MDSYDFSGWVTKNNIRCSDGRTILKDAFKNNDGQTVPLVWNHQHNDPLNVLGHALLENRDDGVYAYCKFNDTESGRNAKLLVEHGDVSALSIFANQLKQKGPNVLHGAIREVSLVLAGANPGAFIDSVIQHGEESDEEAIIYTGEDISLSHADEEIGEDVSLSHAEEKSEEKPSDEKTEKKETDSDETVEDVLNTMSEKQKTVVYAMVAQALESSGETDDDDEGGDETMKHNVFDQEDRANEYTLSHSDMEKIFADAKRLGSLRDAVNQNIEDGVLTHAIDTTGMTVATGNQTYGFNDPSMLFPEYKALSNTSEWLSRDMGWVKKVIGSVHHTPFSRIKSVFANITEDEARARGYIKGKQKKEEVFTTLKRSTDPQTIYKKQKLDRDDIVDIVDFEVVAWIRSEMRVMLNEEIARAILIGDGRPSDSDDKIQESHIRPIITDVPLFNTKVKVQTAASDDESATAKAIIDAAIRARKDYKGSGNPSLFTTEDYLTEMLLLEDGIGHKLYRTESELATALRVKDVITVEPMSGMKVDNLPLIGVIVNMSDYNVGADKGGEINMFDDFDIDYNQQKYLIETRISGALVKPYSALTLLLDKGGASSSTTQTAKFTE